MRVLLAPGPIPDSLTATSVAHAMAAGWRLGAPDDDLVLLPLGDGGPGLVEAVAAVAGGELANLHVPVGPGAGDPSGPTTVEAAVLVVHGLAGRPGRTVVVEASSVLGPGVVGDLPPTVVPSTAFGALLEAVLGLGPDHLVVGVGGVHSHDAGVGALVALGAGGPRGDLGTPSAADCELRPGTSSTASTAGTTGAAGSGGLALGGLAAADLPGLEALAARLSDLTIDVAVDSDAPLLGLHGASAALGLATPVLAAPVTAGTAQDLERAIGHAVHEIGRVLGPGTVREVAARAGAGAGGGLGFALALLGARLRPGAELLAELGGLAGHAASCDLLVTGGPGLDPHALHDSAVPVVAAAGLEVGVPVVVVAQEVVLGRREWSAAGIAGAYAVAEDLDALDAARAEPFGTFAARMQRVAVTWSR